MFHAERSDGITVFLRNSQWGYPALLKMKEDYQFYCPACREAVILKLGRYQAWHFAHTPASGCRLAFTNESESHAAVKEKLFNWLSDSGYKPYMELYLPDVKQKPDILCVINGHYVVIEIQRSNIDPSVFCRRHLSYKDAGYNPVWVGIIENDHCNSKVSVSSLTQLDSMLLKHEPFPHSIYFLAENNKWLIKSGFLYIQPRKILTHNHEFPLHLNPEDLFLNPHNLPGSPFTAGIEKTEHLFFDMWRKKTLKRRTLPVLNLSEAEKAVLPLLLKCQLNLNYFPAVCNIPLRSQFMLNTPPHLWQTWFVLTEINTKPLHSLLRLTTLTDSLYINGKPMGFSFRPSVIHEKTIIRIMLEEYLELLSCAGAVEKLYPGIYKILSTVTVKKPLATLISDDAYVLKLIKNYFVNKNNFILRQEFYEKDRNI